MEIYEHNKADVRAYFIMNTLWFCEMVILVENRVKQMDIHTKFLSQGGVLECSGSTYWINLSSPTFPFPQMH